MKILLIFPILVLILSILAFSAISVNCLSTASNPSYGIYYNGKVYFIAQGAQELEEISNNKVTPIVKLPSGSPFRIAVLDGNLYIVYQKGPLIELQNNRVVWNYSIPHVGKYPAIISADNYVIVTASYGDKVYFISPSHEVKSIKVMSSPQALAYDNCTNVVYVGAYGSNLIYGISLKNFSIVQNITLNVTSVETMVFVPPDELAVAPGHNYFELINLTTEKVIAFDTLNVQGINGYAWLCYIPYDHDVVLSVPHHHCCVFIFNDKGEFICEVKVGHCPNGIVYDPQNHEVYVINYDSSTVSYFSPPAPLVTAKPIPKPNYTPYYIGVGITVVVLAVLGVIFFMKRR